MVLIKRKESFGGVLFNTKNLTHEYVGEEKFQEIKGLDWHSQTDYATEGVLSSPIRVYFETTRECNLRCRSCFNSSGSAVPGELSSGQAMYALESMAQDGVIDVRFTGGEFTQRSDWKELLTAAQQWGFVTTVNTNGVYRNPLDVIDAFVKSGVSQVTLSLDGDEKRHDELRGKGSYRGMMPALKLLQETDIQVRFNSLLLRNNKDCLEEVAQLADEFSDEIDFYHARPIGRGERMLKTRNNFLSTEELVVLHDELAVIADSCHNTEVNYNSKGKRERAKAIQETLEELGLKSDSADGFTALNLGHDGSLWPSCYAPFTEKNLCLGSILKNNIHHIWHKSDVLRAFRNKKHD